MKEKFEGQFPNVQYNIKKEESERSERVAARKPYNPENEDLIEEINLLDSLYSHLNNEIDTFDADIYKGPDEEGEKRMTQLFDNYQNFVTVLNRVIFPLQNTYEVVGPEFDKLMIEKLEIEKELPLLKEKLWEASRKKTRLVDTEHSSSDEALKAESDKANESWLKAKAELKLIEAKIEKFMQRLLPIKERLINIVQPTQYVTEDSNAHLSDEDKTIWKN